jgi:hypothetical protein
MRSPVRCTLMSSAGRRLFPMRAWSAFRLERKPSDGPPGFTARKCRYSGGWAMEPGLPGPASMEFPQCGDCLIANPAML